MPDGLADTINGNTARMRGTDYVPIRCAALTGKVGQHVGCGIYEWRPSPCREFGLRAPLGLGDEACARARARHGLPPLPG